MIDAVRAKNNRSRLEIGLDGRKKPMLLESILEPHVSIEHDCLECVSEFVLQGLGDLALEP